MIELPEEKVAEFVRELCLQVGEVEVNAPEEVDVDKWELIKDAKLNDVEYTNDHLIAWFKGETMVSEKVANATRWQPPEYKNHYPTVWISIEWDLEMAGDVNCMIDVEDPFPRPPGY